MGIVFQNPAYLAELFPLPDPATRAARSGGSRRAEGPVTVEEGK